MFAIIAISFVLSFQEKDRIKVIEELRRVFVEDMFDYFIEKTSSSMNPINFKNKMTVLVDIYTTNKDVFIRTRIEGPNRIETNKMKEVLAFFRPNRFLKLCTGITNIRAIADENVLAFRHHSIQNVRNGDRRFFTTKFVITSKDMKNTDINIMEKGGIDTYHHPNGSITSFCLLKRINQISREDSKRKEEQKGNTSYASATKSSLPQVIEQVPSMKQVPTMEEFPPMQKQQVPPMQHSQMFYPGMNMLPFSSAPKLPSFPQSWIAQAKSQQYQQPAIIQMPAQPPLQMMNPNNGLVVYTHNPNWPLMQGCDPNMGMVPLMPLPRIEQYQPYQPQFQPKK